MKDTKPVRELVIDAMLATELDIVMWPRETVGLLADAAINRFVDYVNEHKFAQWPQKDPT